MKNPSPADRVEEALTPPWGPSLDRFLTARDTIRPTSPFSPPTFRQAYLDPLPQDHWARDPEDLVPEEEETGTCDDSPAPVDPEAVVPGSEEVAAATGAAGQLPGPFPYGRPNRTAVLVPTPRDLEEAMSLFGGPSTRAQILDHSLVSEDYAPMAAWDPAWCAPPDIPDGPRQKGRSPKAYHHQFQPGEGRRETAPSRNTRDAARKARKKKKR